MAPVVAFLGTAARVGVASIRPVAASTGVSAGGVSLSGPVAPTVRERGLPKPIVTAEATGAQSRAPIVSAPSILSPDAPDWNSSFVAQNLIHQAFEDEQHDWEDYYSAWESASQAAFNEPKDHNSVTIKSDTSVKDAAGAVVKVLSRLSSTFVTALRMEGSHEALNRAVKALAVARKYVVDTEATTPSTTPTVLSSSTSEDAAASSSAAASEASTSGRVVELSFLPMNRTDDMGQEDPNLFAFLAFKGALAPGVTLKEHDETDLNVSQGSDPNAMANAIIRIVKERGQAVMKAGGGQALYVAMTAVINARRRLKRNHGMDVMLVPQWITEDTRATLGRESKFLRFNVLPCGLNGMAAHAAAAIVPLQAPAELTPSASYAPSMLSAA
mmetsp:Transcript_15174/g.37799  ORF Transcript_15174/g.37799 Transcript_15174/m.37799 type:complete len:386 (-) Transcript_15174:1128-2285(-)